MWWPSTDGTVRGIVKEITPVFDDDVPEVCARERSSSRKRTHERSLWSADTGQPPVI